MEDTGISELDEKSQFNAGPCQVELVWIIKIYVSLVLLVLGITWTASLPIVVLTSLSGLMVPLTSQWKVEISFSRCWPIWWFAGTTPWWCSWISALESHESAARHSCAPWKRLWKAQLIMFTVSIAQCWLNSVGGNHCSDRTWCGQVYGIAKEPRSLLASCNFQYLGREFGCLFPSPFKLVLDCTLPHFRRHRHALMTRYMIWLANWIY